MTAVAPATRRAGAAAPLDPALDRRFEAVVFDWDGTAVPDRDADAARLRELVEELCALGLELAVITGTHVDNVDGQLLARPSGPGRLHFLVNRGSEVFEAAAGGIRLLQRREASARRTRRSTGPPLPRSRRSVAAASVRRSSLSGSTAGRSI